MQLKAWLNSRAFDVSNGTALANHLIDALGDEDFFRGPLRDLASQPLFRQVLQRQGGGQRAALDQLNQHLAETYRPAVLNELQDLLEAVTGLPVIRADQDSPRQPAPIASPPEAPWHADLRAIAPGVGLAAGSALVLWWAAGRVDDLVPGLHKGGGGLLLALVLLLLQALALGPLQWIRRRWPLNPVSAVDPHQAWRWPLSAWIHQRSGEGLILGLALLLLMAAAPAGLPLLALKTLDLQTVVLRYCLTSLVITMPAVLCARRFRLQTAWSGSAGVVSALVTLAAWESLVHRQIIHLGAPPLLVPAWVLLLVISAMALQAELPRQANDTSRAWQRLLASTWAWGSLLGLSAGVVDWALTFIRQLQSAGRA
jgi:hypothetical protein